MQRYNSRKQQDTDFSNTFQCGKHKKSKNRPITHEKVIFPIQESKDVNQAISIGSDSWD